MTLIITVNKKHIKHISNVTLFDVQSKVIISKVSIRKVFISKVFLSKDFISYK
jgi:hypothetical protein